MLKKFFDYIQVFLPCYKRIKYTEYTLDNMDKNTYYENVQFYLLDDGSNDGTDELLRQFKEKRPNTIVKIYEKNEGLRFRLLEFFEKATADYLVKIDNDCLFTLGWLEKLLKIKKESGIDLLAPDEIQADAAKRYGIFDEKTNCYMVSKSKAVGGLWICKRDLLKNVKFQQCNSSGIRQAWNILLELRHQTACSMAWTTKVKFEHLGHRTNFHELSIKTNDYHAGYMQSIGRSLGRKK